MIANDEKITDDAAETRDEVLARHRRELRELENKTRFMLKQAKKPKKAEVETEVKALEQELRRKQEAELAELVSAPAASTFAEEVTKDRSDETADDPSNNVTSTLGAKREKAKRKKDKKLEQERERERLKAEILANGGPSLRDLELNDLEMKLNADNLQIFEIAADGNCLYRAVAHQLQQYDVDSEECVFSFTGKGPVSFQSLREMAANCMRENRDDFEPFISAEEEIPFDEYCNQVASATDAVWGGQLELLALSRVTGRPIWVYDALQPMVVMGTGEAKPIRLAFHRHFYSLGEHYNSVISK